MKTTMYLLLALTTFLIYTGCETDAADLTTYPIGDTGPSGVGTVFYITDGVESMVWRLRLLIRV